MQPVIPKRILPLIILSQFAGTSLWFAGNAVLPELTATFHLGNSATGHITSAVQLGFITGTLVFALLSVADRFSPSLVFCISSLAGAIANLSIIWATKDFYSLMGLRFLTGFFLAGIYPVGMKIASDWFEKGLGKALGFLVGALVLGTAFPHLLKSTNQQFTWQQVILFTSMFAATGGLLVLLFVKDGPFRTKGNKFHPRNIFRIFKSKDFRAASFGYFGHMWELYTFWAFIPALLVLHPGNNPAHNSLFAFIIIATGFLGCVAGGYVSQRVGSAKVAFTALLVSAICCLFSFFLFDLPFPIFIGVMLVWGFFVVADSPQFSALVAATAPPAYKGTALTFITSTGFAITIASVQLINYLFTGQNPSTAIFMILAIGPVIGLVYMKKSKVTGR